MAFLHGCRRLGLVGALERPRSGRGGHVWLFFEEVIPAVLARRLGSHLLTEAMEDRPDIGLESCDRLFPSQDTLLQGGFGTLIVRQALTDLGVRSVIRDERQDVERST